MTKGGSYIKTTSFCTINKQINKIILFTSLLPNNSHHCITTAPIRQQYPTVHL